MDLVPSAAFVMDKIDHRPWPLPQGRWVMAQRWHDLLFAHWPVPVDELRQAVPAPLQIDTYERRGWVGVIPFRMTGVRLRGLPALPWLSAFPELNVRTYVTYGDKPGVFFFSLDAGNHIAVRIARRWYRLPYYHARMASRIEREWVHYTCRRIHPGAQAAEFRAQYRPAGEAFRTARGSLEHFLTERYCLYAVDSHQRIYRAEIHHLPWPLQPAQPRITGTGRRGRGR